jgi:hypothetical protein
VIVETRIACRRASSSSAEESASPHGSERVFVVLEADR